MVEKLRTKMDVQKVFAAVEALGYTPGAVARIVIEPNKLDVTRFAVRGVDNDTSAPLITDHWTY